MEETTMSQRGNKWHLIVIAAAVVIALVIMLPRHHHPSSPAVNASPAADLHTFTHIGAMGVPASTSDTDFNASMVASPTFHVDGSLLARASFSLIDNTDACVQGYLMPASAPNDPSTYDSVGQVFTIPSVEPNMRWYEWDKLHGDYYIVAQGQDCNWRLNLQK
jgi:hypothetical protein